MCGEGFVCKARGRVCSVRGLHGCGIGERGGGLVEDQLASVGHQWHICCISNVRAGHGLPFGRAGTSSYGRGVSCGSEGGQMHSLLQQALAVALSPGKGTGRQLSVAVGWAPGIGNTSACWDI